MKYNIIKTTHTPVTEETEVDILEQPKFVYQWNGRHIIGIYPEPYDYTDKSKDPTKKGFIYKCWYGTSENCMYIEIPDWQLKEIANRLKSMTGCVEVKKVELFRIITGEEDFEGELSQQDFTRRYNDFKSKLELPN